MVLVIEGKGKEVQDAITLPFCLVFFFPLEGIRRMASCAKERCSFPLFLFILLMLLFGTLK